MEKSTLSLQSVRDDEMDNNYQENFKAFTFLAPHEQGNINNDHPSTKQAFPDNNKKEKPPREHKSLRGIVESFATTTSAHGWGRVGHRGNTKVRVLWLLLTVTALVMNGGHIAILLLQYLDFPYEQVSQVQVEEINFPSITICNIQPVSMTSTNAMLMNTSSKLYQWDNITKIFFPAQSTASYAMEDTLSYELLYNRVRQPLGFFENIGEEAIEIGHQPVDFLLSCTFGLARCNFENFTFYQSPEFYNCYTFNGGNTTKEKLIVKSTGPQAGLSLIMYLESDNGDFLYNGTYYTFGNTANAAGVRVVIHAPDSRPSPSDLGFDVPPGYSSSVGVRATKHRRLGPPHGICRESNDWELGGESYIYSTHACTKQCQQQYVMDLCSCVSADLPIPEYARSAGMVYCGTFNPMYPQTFYDNLSCEINVTQEFMSNKEVRDECGCISPCTEHDYDIKTSYSMWPLDFTQKSFFEKYVVDHPLAEELKAYKNLGGFNMTEIIYQGLIRKNFVRLNVYLESLVVIQYVEKGSYSFYNLWSDIGGTFGLWIGMSILTWIEAIELVINLIYNAVRNRTAVKQTPIKVAL